VLLNHFRGDYRRSALVHVNEHLPHGFTAELDVEGLEVVWIFVLEHEQDGANLLHHLEAVVELANVSAQDQGGVLCVQGQQRGRHVQVGDERGRVGVR